MSGVSAIWVERANPRNAKIVETSHPDLAEGAVRVAIDQAGLTANNVSYAVAGEMLGYWDFFPTGQDGWGIVPVWGYASVIESACADVPVGTSLYGYWPMASHAVLQPGRVSANGLIDAAPHRAHLASTYNHYALKAAEPAALAGFEVERCLFFPLFMTSYLLYDYLLESDFFGASQIIIGSASSKTAFGLAHALAHHSDGRPRIIGVTSPGNAAFTSGLGLYDQVITYGDEASLDASAATGYVDMSGDARLTRALHTHFGENMKVSGMVGATHWESAGETGELPGARPTFFFAPAQIDKRDAEWGRGVIMARALEACAQMAREARGWVDVEYVSGASDIAETWALLVNGEVSPKRGLMMTWA